jgi:hypothetical protein
MKKKFINGTLKFNNPKKNPTAARKENRQKKQKTTTTTKPQNKPIPKKKTIKLT